jgi:hypothetical protein
VPEGPNLTALAAPGARRTSFGSRIRLSQGALVLIAAVVFWLAANRGTYGIDSRSATALAVWWAVVLAAALGLVTLRAPSRSAAVVGGCLAAFALFTLASWAWSPNGEVALESFDRIALYAGVFALVATIGRGLAVRVWADGLALGIVALGLFSLLTRLVPELANTGSPLSQLPGGQARLAYPVGYWNALGILLAIGSPLVLRVALEARHALLRGAAAAVLPAFGAALYLTSSRSGALSAVTGTILFIVAYRRRASVIALVVIAGAGVAVAASVIASRHALMNGPLGSHAAAAQGHSALPLIVVACLAAGVIWGFASRRASRELPLTVERGLGVAVVLVVLAGIVAIHPIRQFDRFKTNDIVAASNPNYATKHLLAASGNGRWKLWKVAYREGRSHLLAGGGAGSFQPTWMQQRPYALYVLNAHSLFMEIFAELGLVGLILFLGFVAGAIAVGVRRVAARADDVGLATALLAAFLAFVAGAGVDWIWQVPAVSIVGVAVAALLCGLGVTRGLGGHELPLSARAAAVAVGLAVIVAQALPLVSDINLRASQNEAGRGRLVAAARSAAAARSVTPWSATPYLQLALIQEHARAFRAAEGNIVSATAREPRNWQYWAIRARIEAEAGAVESARSSLRRAAALNPLWAAANGVSA